MAGNGAVEFFVDTAELGRLRTELQTLQTELGDLPAQDAGADQGAMGADVAGAVDGFAVVWNNGRGRMTENIGQCRVLTEGAAEGYTRAESAIQNAAPVAAEPATSEYR